MNEIIYSQIFLLTLTVGVYLGAVQLRRRVNCALLHPILVSVAALIAFVKLTGMPYEHYMRQTQIIDFLLGLSVVALGYVLHDQIYNIRGNVISIVIAIVTGSAVGILSVALIARWMGAEPAVVASLEPKSVTTAIALSLSANSGGIPALTSVVVIVVGVFGGIVGPWVLRKVGVESRDRQGTGDGSGRARDGHGPRNGTRRRRGSDQRTGDRPDGRRHGRTGSDPRKNHLNETLTRIPKPGLRRLNFKIRTLCA